MDQPDVAVLDQVEQRNSGRLVLLGDRHHEAQVREHERVVRGGAEAHGSLVRASLGWAHRRRAFGELIPRGARLFDQTGEAGLVFLGQQGMTPDVRHVQVNQVLVILPDSPFRCRHGFPALDRLSNLGDGGCRPCGLASDTLTRPE